MRVVIPVRPWVILLVKATVLIQGFHFVEHVAQAVQKFVLGWQKAHGILGFLDLELVHLIYNSLYFLALAALFVGLGCYSGKSRVWEQPLIALFFVFGVLLQGYHEVEHLVKFGQHLETLQQGTPGILGNFFNLIVLHLIFNLLVYLPVLGLLVGYRFEPRQAERASAIAVH